MRRKGRFYRWGKVAEEISGHTLLMCLVFVCFWLVEHLIDLLWPGEKLLFGILPFKWLIDLADLFTFLIFSYVGGVSSYHAYRDGK